MLLLHAMWRFIAGTVGAACFLVPVVSAQIVTEPMALPEGIAATGDTTEVRALTAWAAAHREIHPQRAAQIAERALQLAQNLGEQREIAKSSLLLGYLVFNSDLDQAEIYYMAAQEAYEQVGDELGLFNVWASLGAVHGRRGNVRQALPLLFDALEGFERLDIVECQADVLYNIGNIHKYQDNFDEARIYYYRSIELAESINYYNLVLSALNNMGNTFFRQGKYEESEAIYHQALILAEEREAPYYMALTSNNLGAALNRQGYHESALPFLFRAEDLGSELGKVIVLGNVYDELGRVYMGLGEYDQALRYARASLTFFEEMREEPWYLMEAHQTLSQIYEAAGNDRQALVHYRHYATLRDSIHNAEKAEIVADMQTRYETEVVRRTNEQLEQEIQIQTLRQIVLLGGILVALFVAGLFYYRYRAKRKANHLLEELDVVKSRFFANVSHEFRTPLTVILGSAQDALTGRFQTDHTKLHEQHQAIVRNARQLQRLIDEVLDLNRLEAGHLEPKPIPGDLVRFLKEVVETNAPLAERNGITLTLVCDVEVCPRLYDEGKLEKVVGNLVSNALKFTPRGGSVCVNLHCKDQVEISVTDDGPGIPEEAQSKVFERFAQLDHGVLQGGTGIGLALAKELAELHGGTITLDSTPGEGSMFTLRLPFERTTLTAVQQETNRALPEIETCETTGDGASHTFIHLKESPDADEDRTAILVIEDNDDVRAYIRRSLEETYRVLEAGDGESGLSLAHNALPDLIVSDVMLPDLDGYEIARRLKSLPHTECIPVVMLTARAAETDHVTGYESGAEAYITKPFSPETLSAVIVRLLEERRRMRRQLREEGKSLHGNTFTNGNLTFSDQARVVVLENLHDENFGIEELAAALSVTYRTLFNHLKSDTGLSPKHFIRFRRLERAHNLLSSGAGSVSEVAYAVGFKSLSHFTRSFREYYGTLPSSVLVVRDPKD